VLAFLKAAEGPLEFIDTSDFSVMNAMTPELTTDIAWDPTGRYVVGAVSAWTGKVVSGVSLLFYPQYPLLQWKQVSEEMIFSQLLSSRTFCKGK